eukprot:8388102-Heterocapsa_arctica.AAC.1
MTSSSVCGSTSTRSLYWLPTIADASRRAIHQQSRNSEACTGGSCFFVSPTLVSCKAALMTAPGNRLKLRMS